MFIIDLIIQCKTYLKEKLMKTNGLFSYWVEFEEWEKIGYDFVATPLTTVTWDEVQPNQISISKVEAIVTALL